MYKLFLSPHLDDIIFSLGNYLKKVSNYQNIIIATVFTKENQKKLNKMKGEMYVYGNYKKRIEEDKNAMDELKGARVIYFDLEDEIFRSNESKLKMELKISNKIYKLLLNYDITDIYLPLGIGYHNDHILVNNSVYHLNLSNYNLYYYYDYPYCNNKLNLLTRLSDYGIFNISLNLEILNEYYKDPIYSSLNFFIKSIKVLYLLNRYLFNYLFRQYKLKGDKYSYKIITEEKFKKLIQQRDKSYHKKREIDDIYRMVTTTLSDILRQIVTRDISDPEDAMNPIINILNYSNNAIKEVCKKYSSKANHLLYFKFYKRTTYGESYRIRLTFNNKRMETLEDFRDPSEFVFTRERLIAPYCRFGYVLNNF